MCTLYAGKLVLNDNDDNDDNDNDNDFHEGDGDGSNNRTSSNPEEEQILTLTADEGGENRKMKQWDVQADYSVKGNFSNYPDCLYCFK